MPAAPIPSNDAERIEALRQCCVLDTAPEQRFDDLTMLASRIAGTPISLISLVDTDRQWFKSRVGLDATETPRDMAFCGYAILTPDQPLVVPDATADPRFSDNPLVTGAPHIRFYAGVPLVVEGVEQPLGTLCVIDTQPRNLGSEQLESLQALGRQAAAQLRLNRLVDQLQEQNAEQERDYRRMLEYKTRLEDSVTELERITTTDMLTGLSNRRAFNEQLMVEFHRSVRYESELSLVMVDIDHFKRINDTQGHPMGDEVLEAFGALLRSHGRSSDMAARYGGEEFALILPSTNVENAHAFGERLREQIAARDWPCGRLTASIGITSRQADDTAETLLIRADRALYAAKSAGRNRTVPA